jgi:hypothetical protein
MHVSSQGADDVALTHYVVQNRSARSFRSPCTGPVRHEPCCGRPTGDAMAREQHGPDIRRRLSLRDQDGVPLGADPTCFSRGRLSRSDRAVARLMRDHGLTDRGHRWYRGREHPARRRHEARPATTASAPRCWSRAGWRRFPGTRAAVQTLSLHLATSGSRRGLHPKWRGSGRRLPLARSV